MHRVLIAIALASFAATAAEAQTKISGTFQCGKPDQQLYIPVGDRPAHSLGVDQGKCTYIKPMEIEGAKSKDALGTGSADVSADSFRSRGFQVTTMDTGDKFFVWYQGAGEVKDAAPQGQKGTWGFTGGSGKLKGIKGKGTYTCTPSGEAVTCEVEGEYQLPK